MARQLQIDFTAPRTGEIGSGFIFYLGTNEPSWMEKTRHPLCIARQRFEKVRHKIYKSRCNWVLDSGGYTQITKHGSWELVDTKGYVKNVERWSQSGGMVWCAIQDWMCEDEALEMASSRGIGGTPEKHMELTIDSYIELMSLNPDLPWLPVLQGVCDDDYEKHMEDYARRGVFLDQLPHIGVGSVCRRQSEDSIISLFRRLESMGIARKCHGFGVKTTALTRFSIVLGSADSTAWSFSVRRKKIKHPGCTARHKNCNSCLMRGLYERRKIIAKINGEEFNEPG